MVEMLSTVMQLFQGSYFSVAAVSRPLWPNSAIANGTTYMNYVSPAPKWRIKNHIFKVYKWSVNIFYLVFRYWFDFKGTVTCFLCMCGVLISGLVNLFSRFAFGEKILFRWPWDAQEGYYISIQELFGLFWKF